MTTTTIIPPAWLWLFDEAVPQWVKKTYSPRESWKDKPFGPEDTSFFFKGIAELSDLFTDERPKGMPNYFQHPKYRSGYLLYFLPLQAAKFTTLFQMHSGAIDAALEHGRRKGALRIADLSAGPGTASIGLLVYLLARKLAPGEELPPIHLDWVDTNRDILLDGKALVEMLASHFPRLRGKVKVEMTARPWRQTIPQITKNEYSLILMGHLLNEGPDEEENADALARLLPVAHGGGILMVEPAARRPSQLLSRIRDRLIEGEAIAASASSIWGPCLHAGRCPLAEGRDWCHFSVPTEIPGKLFRAFSRKFGSERQWVKFCYLWLASQAKEAHRPKAAPANERLVISDPMPGPGGDNMILLCEPDKPARIRIPAKKRLHRGDKTRV